MRSTIWASLRGRSSQRLPLTGYSSAPALTPVSRTCAQRRRCWRAGPRSARTCSPGSTVEPQAEDEGLDRIFREAGLEWGESGCSMCRHQWRSGRARRALCFHHKFATSAVARDLARDTPDVAGNGRRGGRHRSPRRCAGTPGHSKSVSHHGKVHHAHRHSLPN